MPLYDIAVLCDPDAFDFHWFDRIAGLRHVDPDEVPAWPAVAVVRLGQPFEPDDLTPLYDHGAVCVVSMVDTIATDCQQLDDVGLAPECAGGGSRFRRDGGPGDAAPLR